MKEKGHSFLITAREKDVTLDLLGSSGISCVTRGKGSHTSSGRFLYSIAFILKNIRTIRKFSPEICVGIGSPYLVMIARLLKIPGIVFEDTESAKKVLWIYKRFADVILTPSCFKLDLGPSQIRFDSYKEFAYLHNKFYKPDPSIFHLLNVPSNERFVLFRFVSHKVNHDKTNDGLTQEMKKVMVKMLSSMIKVFVSTEKGLIPQFPELEIKVPPERMHDVVAFSQLVIGESSTMAAEAAVLGVPSVFFDNYGRGYTDELEQIYKIVNNYNITPASVEKAINKTIEILNAPDYINTRTFQHRLIEEKIDITSLMVWFVEQYPESARIMKKDPDYQNRFR